MLRLLTCCILLITAPTIPVAAAHSPIIKTVTVKVLADQQCFIDGYKVNFWELGTELHKRIWRTFMGNDKMPDNVLVVYEGDVNDETKSATLKSVKEAQQRTLTMYALFKYKKKYEDLADNKKEKIKKLFPILFQQDFAGVSQ
ncbi:MAG: hypothetical protein IPP73_06100 [Chitinophagaceae bacterium]|nr:hypothetical protein [Chitinophagaceae bacterium]